MLPGKRLTPVDIIAILKRSVWIVAIPPVVCFFAALLYSSRVPNVYQADMLIAVDPQRVPGDFVKPTVTLATDRRLDAITVQVLSRTNLQRMVDHFSLYADQRRSAPLDDVVAKMRDNIDVELEKTTREDVPPNAFHVRFTHESPEIAARVTQELGSLFVDQNSRDRIQLASATNDFLEEQLAEARAKLETQEQRLEVFRQRHGKSLPTQMQANLQALQTLQLRIQAAVESVARDRDRRQMLERLYRDAVAQPATAARPPAGTPERIGTAQQQLDVAREQLAGLELKYTPDHPDVTRARRRVADLTVKAEAEAAAARVAGGIRGEILTVQDPRERERLAQMQAEIESLGRQIDFKESEEKRLRAEVADYQSRVDAVPGLESEWASLTRDYDTQQAEYKDLLTKSGNARVAEVLEDRKIGETFRIVDAAEVPIRPIPSQRLQINALGALLGLALGLAAVAFRELRDESFRTETEVMEVLGLPVLASVPFVESAVEASRRVRRMRMAALVGLTAVGAMTYLTVSMKLWKSVL